MLGALPVVLLFATMLQAESPGQPEPVDQVVIPAGTFQMGDTFQEGASHEWPVREITLSAFSIDRHHVSKALWDQVREWALANGYVIANRGRGKADDHPVHTLNWYDAVKWCNARSEMEGLVPVYYTSPAHTTVYRTGQFDIPNDWVKWNANGYRLPTEAEWEKAARGGVAGNRFPWGDRISHEQANYWAGVEAPYDASHPAGFHPTFATGVQPHTSPVQAFPPNGYGLHDMAGNLHQWCWDWWSESYDKTLPQTDPRGPTWGETRVIRGGGWHSSATDCRSASRYGNPMVRGFSIGFRTVRTIDPP
jgi:formylglycine-generating enzyme required for sulfatase activity